MQYSSLREHIKTGDLLAWTHRGWGSWYDIQIQIVRMFTRSEYSHVGIAWCLQDRLFVLEAVGRGVIITPLSHTLPFYWIANKETFTEEQLNKAVSYVGYKYKSKLRMIWDAITNSYKEQEGHLQCSEYVNKILSLSAYPTPTQIVQTALKKWGNLNYVE